MERSLRKVKVRRENVKSGHRAQKGTGEIAAEMVAQAEAERAKEERYVDPYAETVEDVRPGQIVRTKEHPATPMSVDDALSEMELVGHDFFLLSMRRTISRPWFIAATPTTTALSPIGRR